MSWFRRCQHNFKYYYKEKDYDCWRVTSDYKFFFVCSKCKKQIVIKDCDIIDAYEDFQREEALNKVLGVTNLPTASLVIPYALKEGQILKRLCGNAAYKTRQYFLDTCGVDITTIDNNNKKEIK